MIFNFTRNYQFSTRIKLNDSLLKTISETRLLGSVLTSDLKWHANSDQLIKKGYQRMSMLRNYAHIDGGPRSRVRARGTLLSAPHRRERKFSGAPVCRIAFKHLPQPLRSHTEVSELYDKSFQDIFEISRFSAQNRVNGGLGSPPKNFHWNLPTYVTWEPIKKFGAL